MGVWSTSCPAQETATETSIPDDVSYEVCSDDFCLDHNNAEDGEELRGTWVQSDDHNDRPTWICRGLVCYWNVDGGKRWSIGLNTQNTIHNGPVASTECPWSLSWEFNITKGKCQELLTNGDFLNVSTGDIKVPTFWTMAGCSLPEPCAKIAFPTFWTR